jgi:hypothetical protein
VVTHSSDGAANNFNHNVMETAAASGRDYAGKSLMKHGTAGIGMQWLHDKQSSTTPAG